MKELLNFIDHTIQVKEKFLVKFREGTSQHSLLRNRIRALETARDLISGERIPDRDELEFALPRVESILSKTRKARDKYEPGSRNYRRFDPTVQITEQIRDIVLGSLEGDVSGLQK